MRRTLIVLIAVAAPAHTASAAVIYAADYYVGIKAIDLDAMTVKQVMSAYVYNVAPDPLGGGLYFTSSYDYLRRYDFATKKQTTIKGDFISGNSMTEWDDGFLYSGGDGNLWQVDTTTGKDKWIGSDSGETVGDFAASPSGVMYGVFGEGGPWEFSLDTVNPATGKHTPVAPLGFPFTGLAFTSDGRMWAASDKSTWLYEIDPATGTATPVFDLGFKVWDLASEVVPSPASVSLLTLASAAATRRRSRPPGRF